MNAVISAPDQPAQTTVSPPLRWTQRFHQLGGRFFTELDAQPVPSPYWVAHNESLARDLGLPPDWLTRPEFRSIDVLSGNALWPGMQPLASVYSGHQFGVWAGQLGDGRALWLGEIETPVGPQEIQLKGAGLTPYSRMGDGRAVLRSSIREFLCSEAMHGLGIPTTRALAVTGSPLTARREEIETAAIVTRVAPSFIRFGHFEHFAHTAGDDGHEALRTLADFVIDHYYPECRDSSSPYATLLQTIAERTGRLIAQWQCVGFCHGVMNTDNMSILGLTIDYGPFGFLDGFDPGHICNHSDNRGRYAYARQPNAGFWNVHALAQALMPLIGDSDAALEAIEPYKAALGNALQAGMRGKLGLAQVRDDDAALIDALFALMSRDKTDMTILFRRLSTFSMADGANHDALRDLFIDREAFDAWASRYADRLKSEQSDDTARRLAMNRVNPKYVLRNHLADVAIRQAREGDFNETRRLLELLERPFDDQPDNERYADFPPAWAQHIEVSCSS